VITGRPWVAIAGRSWRTIGERPWLAGGLLSGATTIAIVSVLVLTQPGGPEWVPNDPSLVAAAAPDAAPAPSAVAAVSTAVAAPTASASATVKAPVARTKAKVKAPAKKAAATKAASAGTSTSGAGGSGTGRIQFGHTYSGRATFYAATGAGNCSFDATGDLMVAAMNQTDYENSQACGAHLSVTGPNGTVTVRVVDRCPECPPGAIDLSKQAFARIAPVSAGRVPITWHLLSPAGLGSVSYRYKTGSSQYWCAIQVLNHRNPVRALQVKTGGKWVSLDREDYNYFVSAGGSGCGGTIRVSDIYGNQITATGITIAPDQIQPGKSQFPAR
jgi:expansin (peptidoglycan-binding protein)